MDDTFDVFKGFRVQRPNESIPVVKAEQCIKHAQNQCKSLEIPTPKFLLAMTKALLMF